MKKNVLILVVFTLVFSACASMNKDAKKLMEEGNFAQAIDVWDQVLKEHPDDVEAKHLKEVAREELLNVDLVTLKGLLDSHQTIPAFDQLQATVDKRKKWNVGLDPNSFQYLREQTERLYGQYLIMMQEEVQKKQPLKALFLEKKYRKQLPLEVVDEESKIKSSVQLIGQDQCKNWDQASKNFENLRLYAISFCKSFGISVSLSSANEAKLKSGLLKLPQFELKVDGLTAGDNAVLKKAIADAIQQAPQFSAVGANASSIFLGGAFVQKQEKSPKPMSHSYVVQVPYPVERAVNNPTSEPYTETENRCDSTGTHCWQEGVTRYRMVDHWESIHDTEIRPEPRVYEFIGTELDQSITLQLQTQVKSNAVKISLPFQDHFNQKILTHDLNLLDIGLVPMTGSLTTREQWLADELPKITASLMSQLQQNWIELHCKVQSRASETQLADQVFACLRSSSAIDSGLVKNWLISQTGLKPENAFTVLEPLKFP